MSTPEIVPSLDLAGIEGPAMRFQIYNYWHGLHRWVHYGSAHTLAEARSYAANIYATVPVEIVEFRLVEIQRYERYERLRDDEIERSGDRTV